MFENQACCASREERLPPWLPVMVTEQHPHDPDPAVELSGGGLDPLLPVVGSAWAE